MAEYELTLDEERKFLRATVRGDLAKAQGRNLVVDARTRAAKVGYGILWDVRKANLQVKLADFFLLPMELKELQACSTRSVSVALLIPLHAKDSYQFYEDVASNVGLNVKIFVDENEAITWLSITALTGNQSSTPEEINHHGEHETQHDHRGDGNEHPRGA